MTAARAKVFEHAVEVDRGGRMTVPGGAQVERPEGWSPDHLLLAALVRCSIDSLVYHARRAGHEATAAGSARGTITKRESDGRYAFVEVEVSLDVQLVPRGEDTAELIAKAERDCFVAASLTVTPDYTWRMA